MWADMHMHGLATASQPSLPTFHNVISQNDDHDVTLASPAVVITSKMDASSPYGRRDHLLSLQESLQIALR